MDAGDREKLGRRNLWAVSVTSFLTDVSSEMVLHLIPLLLTGVFGAGALVVGAIEGGATAIASLVKIASGRLSDQMQRRKGLAVFGYGLSAAAKPFFALVASPLGVAVVRWVERLGKGVRTAPRDALLADTTRADRRGFVFGLHRAADTAGAVIGLAIAALVISQSTGGTLDAATFRRVVYWSLIPAFLAVAVLALVAREPRHRDADRAAPRASPPLRQLGRPFFTLLGLVALFDLGNSADAFLVLRASERGLSAVDILWMLLAFNLVYAATATPSGSLSDRFGRKGVLLLGWTVYALVYLGLARAESGSQVVALVLIYGLYHGLTQGTVKAMVADLVPPDLRGTAYGLLAAVLALLDLPASLVAGVLWEGFGTWEGFGPAGAFGFGAAMAGLATIGLLLWTPPAHRTA